jgi:hypothetical protein
MLEQKQVSVLERNTPTNLPGIFLARHRVFSVNVILPGWKFIIYSQANVERCRAGVWSVVQARRELKMDRKRKDLYYGLPGSKKGSQERRKRNAILAIAVGIGAAGILGTLMYLKARMY